MIDMFESITIFNHDRQSIDAPLDIGILVECLLFYSVTEVIANRTILKQLFLYFGIDRIIELIEEDILKLSLAESMTAIQTVNHQGQQYYSARIIETDSFLQESVIWDLCNEIVGKSGKARRKAQRLHGLIKAKKHDGVILTGAEQTILDKKYIDISAKNILKCLVPEIRNFEKAFFHAENTSNGISIETNINFTKVNNLYHKRISPEHSTITPAYVLTHILDTEAELYFTSNNLSEIATSPMSSQLLSSKVNYILERSMKSQGQLDEFKSMVFDEARSVRDAVNKKEVDLDDLLSALKRAKKFKKWLVGIEPEQKLIKEYYASATEKTLIERLPLKTLKWGIFLGLGLYLDSQGAAGFGTVAGVGLSTITDIGLSALDTFALDKMLAGWKPSQFIEHDVSGLLPRKEIFPPSDESQMQNRIGERK